MFSFFTSGDSKRKKQKQLHKGCSQAKCFAGRMPKPERRRQEHQKDKQKLLERPVSANRGPAPGKATALLAALVFWPTIRHQKSTVVREKQTRRGKALDGARHRKGSNYRYCFIMISKDNSRQNGKHIEPEPGRGLQWLYIKTFENQESLLRGFFGMKSGDCLCLVWFKSNQQIHLLENGVIKLFVCVETWCGSLDT